MSQSVVLNVSGIYTSMSDYQGLPPGALDAATNLESRYKNVLEPRRGFENLENSVMSGIHLTRLSNFYIQGVDSIVGITSDRDLVYYDGSNPWPLIPGNVTHNIIDPNSVNAKSRFITAGQNLYVTAQDGVRSLSSGGAAIMIRAGVPRGLNLEGETNGDVGGFLENNTVLATTGNIVSGSANITNLASTSGIAVGQYVSGTQYASIVIQDLTYTSVVYGTAGNAITVEYTGGGTAGSEVVTVLANAITVQIDSGVSTAIQVKAAIDASAEATALVSVTISGTGSNAQITVGPTSLASGIDETIPIGTTVQSITPEAPIIIQTGTTTAGSTSITAVPAITGIVAGVLVSGTGIPEGAQVVSTSGAGPYTVVLDLAAYQTASGVSLTFTSPKVVVMDDNATQTLNNSIITFYSGAQVAYRMVFGRVEIDINGNTITRLGAPSQKVIVTSIAPYATNVEVTGTIPKNSEDELTFFQLYRSIQTDSAQIEPLDQYNLVYERNLDSSDFVARTVTVEDIVSATLVGIPLYSGSDQEGADQGNDPPPMCWDMCKFRDFTLFGNITRPTTLGFTIVSVEAPDGIQVGDTIEVTGTFLGVPFSQSYVASATEDPVTFNFKVFSTGTPSQDIADTANSFIRVFNYDESVPVHAILVSDLNDLPGQIRLEADDPSYDLFTVNASRPESFDPELNQLESDISSLVNGIAVSKSGELEAVPALNVLFAGDSSSPILRLVPLRDYVVVLKTDGIYKIQGLSPSSLFVNPFDLTTKIIGADTAVSLNSSVWMLSNQGVVSISDGGVDAKSIPIDDQLNRLINNYYDALNQSSFAVGYESDRKYILGVPDGDTDFAQIEYNLNYVTNCWTTWDRNFYTGFIHSNEGKLYVARADTDDTGVSRERKTGTYQDQVDEGFDVSIVSVSGLLVELNDASQAEIGDVLFQSDSLFSIITDVDLVTQTVTTLYEVPFNIAAAEILTAFECMVTWKQVFGDNPAFLRQFSEGMVLFKNTRFNTASLDFVTDFSNSDSTVEVIGQSNGLWGLFPWGEIPWGGESFPTSIRFFIPQDKQLGSYILPTLTIKQGFSNFIIQGLSISYFNQSMEVGIT